MSRLTLLVPLIAACAEPAAELPPSDSLPTAGEPFVISELRVPSSATEAHELGLDLDGDDRADNALGITLAAIATSLEIELSIQANEAIAAGDGLMLLSFHRDPGASLDVGRLFLGADADDDPGNNLAGDGQLEVRADAPLAEAVFGSIDEDHVSLGGGRLTVENVLFAPVAVTLAGARIEARREGDQVRGVISGAVPSTAMRSQVRLVASLAIAAETDETCEPAATPCCPSGSRAGTYVAVFDADEDCQLTVDEVASSDLMAALLAPDLDLDGDGERDATSFAFGFTAVPARFEVPEARF